MNTLLKDGFSYKYMDHKATRMKDEVGKVRFCSTLKAVG